MYSRKILLVSESYDKSTENVIDWLTYFKANFERKNINHDFTNLCLKIDNKTTKTTLQNNVVWYRRGYLSVIPTELLNSPWITYLKKEQLPFLEAIEFLIDKRIGSYYLELNNNKLINLQFAKQVGLKIPNTIVTNNKVDLLEFVEADKKYITKSLVIAPLIENEKFYFSGSGTIELDFTNLDEIFAPSLVQEYIEKDIEIRTFFVENEYYSMAIFSQYDNKTAIDYRNYNVEKPNRNVPFELPNEILLKLKKFAKKINCTTGSIDLILNKDSEFIFLEINPMGQYHWLSENCNYYIDKKIAEKLIEKSNEY
jgi:ATP-GRASP peptide maturase of grasp-with-spasm system